MDRENKLYFVGRLAYSFGKNGRGLSNEFDILNQLIKNAKLEKKEDNKSIN